MALVTALRRVKKDRPKRHEATTCDGTWFDVDGKRYVQLDTFGTSQRKDVAQISQSIQFDAKAARQLRALLDEAFPLTE